MLLALPAQREVQPAVGLLGLVEVPDWQARPAAAALTLVVRVERQDRLGPQAALAQPVDHMAGLSMPPAAVEVEEEAGVAEAMAGMAATEAAAARAAMAAPEGGVPAAL